jgi:hypothetical protein
MNFLTKVLLNLGKRINSHNFYLIFASKQSILNNKTLRDL